MAHPRRLLQKPSTARVRLRRGRRLAVESLEGRLLLDAGPLMISEFMADNTHTLADADGEYSDWIEIHNPGDVAVDLGGWSLTDDPAELAKWRFPSVPLAAKDYLVVFASGKDRGVAGAELHTNFRLDSGGEYLALVQPDGATIAQQFAPEYPQQYPDVSYGFTRRALTMLPEGSRLSYLVPTSADAALGSAWMDGDFDDRAWLGSPARDASVLVTEAGTATVDYVEIQNVSEAVVDTAGWVVAANNAVANNINDVVPVLWTLPSSVSAGQILYKTDSASDNYWGGDIYWRTVGNGWVMIVDDLGQMVDFVVWGYSATQIASLHVTINGHDIAADSFWWQGASVPSAGASSNNALQRGGNYDRNTAADWAFVGPASKGTQNSNLANPFPRDATSTGIGFTADGSGFGGAVHFDVGAAMRNTNASLWTRIPFELSDPSGIAEVQLRMKYNDGFVAYLNGREIARRNAPDVLDWNSTATAQRTAAESSVYEEIDLSGFRNELRAGHNLLAVHGLNVARDNGDFLVLPKLVALDNRGIERYLTTPTPYNPNPTGFLVINEIHYDPMDKTQPAEFIEIFNASDATVDLSGWRLDRAVNYTFPAGTVIQSERYLVVAEDVATMRTVFNVTALGPWVGNLAADGERVVLRTASGGIEDEVDYRSVFPWPINARGEGSSMELIHPLLDNDLGGSWRPSGGATIKPPTPGARNSVYAEEAPPQVRQVRHDPQQPAAGQAVVVTAKVTDPDGVARVGLQYQLVDPGRYIRLTDAKYKTDWTSLVMRDDGTAGDEQAGDGVYTVVLPAAVQTNRRLVRYRITGEDVRGNAITAPFADDPQPNFAYLVYNGVPAWTGANQPGTSTPVTFGADVMNQLPAYHLIANGTDVTNCQYNSGYEQTRFLGTLVYDGEVYDHIEFGIRGEFSTYVSGKNKWKFFFNPGHDFQARDPYGQEYQYKWRTMNFSPASTPWMPVHRGMAGIDDAIAFRLYELAGVPSSHLTPLQFRVIDDAVEASPSSQYDGDLWGTYWAVEQPEGRFLDERGLPDGNVYKIENGGGDKKNQGPTQSKDNSDINALISRYGSSQTIDWWRANVDLAAYYSFRSIDREINNMDIREGWNVFYYHRPDTNQWVPIPWDLDMLYSPVTHWSGVINMQNAILQHPVLMREYQARGRELQDLLFTEDQLGQLVDEFAAFVNPPGEPLTMVDVDQFLWNYNPRTSSSHRGRFYTNPADAQPIGWSPASIRTLVSADHEGMAQWIKDFMLPAPGGGSKPVAYGFDFLKREAADNDIPNTPSISYTGPAAYPIDALSFLSGAFHDPQGDNTFGAMEWRVGEVSDPNAPAYDPTRPRAYEVTPVWQSGPLSTFGAAMTVPGDQLQIGHAYRVRVRMQDNTGRWSHWSDPVQFIAGAPASRELDWLRVTEVMYNPVAPTAAELTVSPAFVKDDFEFIELRNIGSRAIDLRGVEFDQGIDFAFSGSQVTSLAPGEYVLVVKNSAAFQARYGAAQLGRVAGQYGGRLNNDGELLTLVDPFGQTLMAFTFGDTDAWPGRPDGSGSSLELADPAAVPNTAPERTQYLQDGNHWRASSEYGGSPGWAGRGPINEVVINEVLSNTDASQLDAIELMNTTDHAINISGWYLSDTNAKYDKYRIPAPTIIAPGGYLVFDEADFNPDPLHPGPNDFALNGAHGDDVWLVQPDAAGKPAFFADHVQFGAARAGESLGRWPNGSGGLYPMVRPTLDPAQGANSGPRIGPLVISEVQPRPNAAVPDDFEFVEIYNPTAATVSLANWQIRGDVDFEFPVTAVLASHATLVVLPFDMVDTAKLAAFRSFYKIDASVPLVGGYRGRLNDVAGEVRLERPDTPPPDEPDFVPHVLEDQVNYAAAWLPVAGSGRSLNRLGSRTWGDASGSWTAAAPSPGSAHFVAAVADRRLFYNGSAFDGDDPAANAADDSAIAVDKKALLPGQTATFANYTSYSRGINGLMIDLVDLPDGAVLGGADFRFRVGNTNDLTSWTDALAPSSIATRRNGDGTDRVTLLWPDGAVRNQWLQVTVLATPNTALVAADVFYFGNAIGETGDSAGDARVTATDVVMARNNPRTFREPAPIDFAYDFNRDGRVNAIDMLLARNNQTGDETALGLITAPAGKAGNQKAARRKAAWADVDWTPRASSAVTPIAKERSVPVRLPAR